MDIEFLLTLQSLRNQLGGGIAGAFTAVSSLSAGCFLWLPACLLFWGGRKEAGRGLFLTMGLGLYLTNLLKLTFCVPRPWVRCSQIHPLEYPGGYSFPSGHSTAAACNYGTLAGLCGRKKWMAAVFIVMIPLTMLSRNYLGVHTPQDVLAGCGVGLLMVLLVPRLCRWMEKAQSRERVLFLLGVLLTAGGLVYLSLKPYPAIPGIDPAAMRYSGVKAAGQLFGLMAGLAFERRLVDFSAEVSRRKKALRWGTGLLLLLLLERWAVPLGVSALGAGGCFLMRAAELFLLTGGYPWCFQRWERLQAARK